MRPRDYDQKDINSVSEKHCVTNLSALVLKGLFDMEIFLVSSLSRDTMWSRGPESLNFLDGILSP